jgi:hypothetical protein
MKIASGLNRQGNIITIFELRGGFYSSLEIKPDGEACLVDHGRDIRRLIVGDIEKYRKEFEEREDLKRVDDSIGTCHELEEIYGVLLAKRDQEAVLRVTSQKKNTLGIFLSPKQTWTMIAPNTEGKFCVADRGKMWRFNQEWETAKSF